MYDTVLVPIDLSDDGKAELMLGVAQKLANPGALIVLTHVVEDIPAYVTAQLPKGVFEERWTEASRRIEEIAATVGGRVEVEIRGGHAANTILEAAAEKGAGVIVIASHRPGLQDYLIGSTAARVVRHAQCSVFVLR